MLVGYARISPSDQSSALQLDALRGAGCERIYTDEGVSGGSLRRPALDSVIKAVKPGDVLVVWKLDRLGRSLSHLIQLTKWLGEKGIGFRSLSEAIDTTAAQGHLVFRIMGALAEFERSLITERTRVGVAAARRRGVKAGRKPKLTPEKIALAQRLLDHGESPGDVAKSVDVSLATLYRHMPAAASNRTTMDLFNGSTR